jgi:hypothetical protein
MFWQFFISILAISNLIVKTALTHIVNFAVTIQMFQIQPNFLVMKFRNRKIYPQIKDQAWKFHNYLDQWLFP